MTEERSFEELERKAPFEFCLTAKHPAPSSGAPARLSRLAPESHFALPLLAWRLSNLKSSDRSATVLWRTRRPSGRHLPTGARNFRHYRLVNIIWLEPNPSGKIWLS